MEITIKPSCFRPDCYSLYINGNIAVSYESMTVCSAVKEALERPMTGRFYSEGAEVADRIRNVLPIGGEHANRDH